MGQALATLVKAWMGWTPLLKTIRIILPIP